MGTILKMVVALGIGFALLTGAQHLWMAAMQQRIEATSNDTSYLPPSQPVTIDTSKMRQLLEEQPKIDMKSFAEAGRRGMIQDMELRRRAAEIGVPSMANGVPLMPGQGVPLQYQHPPGVPFR